MSGLETEAHTHRVLIVEDDLDARESLATLLEVEGYEVCQAQNGEEALRVLRSSQVCIVLLDIFMPVMNGYAFLSERGRDPALADIPVVVITADPAAARQAAGATVAAALRKPVDFNRLLDLVGRYC